MTPPTTLAGRPPIWYCHPNEITCRYGHVRRHAREGFHLDQRRVDGHLFVGCDQCQPTTFAFGIITSRPSPRIEFYAITKAQYDEWINTADDALELPLDEGRETLDLLHRLGYNPTFTRKGR